MSSITPKNMRNEFVERINELSGQNVDLCFQCGTCSGSCPMSDHMDASTRKTMHMAQLGLAEMLENINTCQTCASCHSCSVRCPRGIDIARVMEALRLVALGKNQNFIEPSRMSPEMIKEMPQIALVAGFRKLTS